MLLAIPFFPIFLLLKLASLSLCCTGFSNSPRPITRPRPTILNQPPRPRPRPQTRTLAKPRVNYHENNGWTTSPWKVDNDNFPEGIGTKLPKLPDQDGKVGWQPDPSPSMRHNNIANSAKDDQIIDILNHDKKLGDQEGCVEMGRSVQYPEQPMERFSFLYTSTDRMLSIYPVGELVVVQCSAMAQSSGIPLYSQDLAGRMDSFVFGARFICDQVSRGWIPAPFDPPTVALKCFDLKASFREDKANMLANQNRRLKDDKHVSYNNFSPLYKKI